MTRLQINPGSVPGMKPARGWFSSLLPMLLLVIGCGGPAVQEDPGPGRWHGFEPLEAMEEGPTYHLLEGYNPKWLDQVREGIELARAYWGSYGPTHVWVLGCEDGVTISEGAWQDFLEEYCTWRTGNSRRSIADCFPHARERFQDVALSGAGEAYLSEVREVKPHMAELIFINVHRWSFEEDSIPDPVLRGIHEYTHVFQQSGAEIPTWMAEGGAVFAEAWLPGQEGRREPAELMQRVMENARRIEDRNLTIADMEEIETAPAHVARFHRELAYDAGAWAMVFMVHHSARRSVSSLRDRFYPLVKEIGWHDALCKYVGMSSKQEFYAAFDQFMALPMEQQLATLAELKP